jgi:hypothetical protein
VLYLKCKDLASSFFLSVLEHYITKKIVQFSKELEENNKAHFPSCHCHTALQLRLLVIAWSKTCNLMLYLPLEILVKFCFKCMWRTTYTDSNFFLNKGDTLTHKVPQI